MTSEYQKRWYDRAACKGLSEFFDTDCGDNSIPQDQLTLMKKICGSCPVIEECLQDSLDFSEEYTFRAGLTASQRKKLMRKLGIKSWTRKQMETMDSGATWYSRLR